MIRRTEITLSWWTNHFANAGILDIALDHLTLGLGKPVRCRHLLKLNLLSNFEVSKPKLEVTVNSLRHSSMQEFIVHGLRTRAWLRFCIGVRRSSESAQEDLEEAWEIAVRGPMRLHMADIHLYRARLFFREKRIIRGESLGGGSCSGSKTLIEQCGYWRRKEKLRRR